MIIKSSLYIEVDISCLSFSSHSRTCVCRIGHSMTEERLINIPQALIVKIHNSDVVTEPFFQAMGQVQYTLILLAFF